MNIHVLEVCVGVCIHCNVSVVHHMQFYDDKNVTQIDEKRFNQEHCNTTCYQNYTMPDLVYWGVHLGCWNEVNLFFFLTSPHYTHGVCSCVYLHMMLICWSGATCSVWQNRCPSCDGDGWKSSDWQSSCRRL